MEVKQDDCEPFTHVPGRRLNKGPRLSAGGDGGAAAEVGGAERPQPVSAAADPAGGARGGGRGAGERRAAELHRRSAPQHEPDPAGPGRRREPRTDLCRTPGLQTQVCSNNRPVNYRWPSPSINFRRGGNPRWYSLLQQPPRTQIM